MVRVLPEPIRPHTVELCPALIENIKRLPGIEIMVQFVGLVFLDFHEFWLSSLVFDVLHLLQFFVPYPRIVLRLELISLGQAKLRDSLGEQWSRLMVAFLVWIEEFDSSFALSSCYVSLESQWRQFPLLIWFIWVGLLGIMVLPLVDRT